MRSRPFLVLLAVLVLTHGPVLVSAGPFPQADELAAVPRISQQEFEQALAAGSILVLDVRDATSYANGHIPAAVSMPLDELSKHIAQLKKETRPIVAYCA